MTPYRVVITDFGDADNDIEARVLEESGLDVELVRQNCRVADELIPLVADADALIVQFAPITRKVIESLQRCQVISRYGIGVDMVDLQAASEKGIPVANVPDFCIEEVSTQTIGFVIDLNRRTFAQHKFVVAGNWGKPMPVKAPVRLQQQVLGVVGLGNIGRQVVRYANALGMKVIGHDPYVASEAVAGLPVEIVSLEDLLERSDYVSLHCPLVAETRGMIGQAQFEAMKPSAFLINMARGPVVNQTALYHALLHGTIAGAALDVLEAEPPQPDDPILALDNVIITPHSSSWSLQGYNATPTRHSPERGGCLAWRPGAFRGQQSRTRPLGVSSVGGNSASEGAGHCRAGVSQARPHPGRRDRRRLHHH